MKFAFTSILFLAVISAFAQFPASPNAYDEKNLKTGYWTLLYDSAGRLVNNPDSASSYCLLSFEKGVPAGKARTFRVSFSRQWDGYLKSVSPEIKFGESNFYYENGQVQYHCFYEQNKLNGPFQQYSPKGILTATGNMRNDTTEGKWTFFYPTGIRSAESTRTKGLDEGFSIRYYESGNKFERGQMLHGQRTGLWETFYDSGGLAKTSNYEKGLWKGPYRHYSTGGTIDESGEYENDSTKTGSWTYYDDDGHKESEGSYLHNRKTGNWNYYYPNGKLKRTGQMTGGQQEGAYVYYHDNGETSARGIFLHNNYEGPWTFYFANGRISREAIYLRDSLQGRCIYYFENGRKKSEGNYVLGKKTGHWIYYTSGGTIDGTEDFINDKLDGEATDYFPDGSVLQRKTYSGGVAHGSFIAYHAANRIREQGAYQTGEKNGEWKTYSPAGQLLSRDFYVAGRREGECIVYFENGKISSDGHYNGGNLTGWSKYYFSNGILKKEGNAVNGHYEGKWTTYDSITGKKYSTGNYVHDLLDGRWIFYDKRGKKTDVSWYNHGFWETASNITDSITHLMDLQRYDLALKDIDWLKRVIHRDWPAMHKINSRPLVLTANIALEQGDYTSALSWFQAYGASVKKLEGDTTINYKAALNGVALCKVNLGLPLEAIPLYDQILATQPSSSPDYPTTVANKSFALLKANKEADAVSLLESSLTSARQQYGDTSSTALDILASLGYFNSHWTDNYEKSLTYYTRYMQVLDQRRQERDERYADGQREVANDYKLLNNRAEAIRWYREAVLLRDTLDDDNPIPYLLDLTELAKLYLETGREDTAALLFNEVIKKSGDLTNNMIYARALDGLASVDYYRGANQKAIDGWRKSLSILEGIHQNKDIYYTGMLQGVGLAIEGLGENKGREAAPWFIRAVNISHDYNGEKHLHYQRLLLSLAGFYRKERQFQRADSVCKLAERLIAGSFGTDSEVFADCLDEQGRLAYDQEGYEEAIRDFQRSLGYWKPHRANNPYITAERMMDLAKAQRYSGHYDDAEKTVRELILMYETGLKDTGREYLLARRQLANILTDENLLADAEAIYLSLLKEQGKATGEGSVEYGYDLESIGSFYYLSGDFKKSEKYFLQYFSLLNNPVYRTSWQMMELELKLANLYAAATPSPTDGIAAAQKADRLYRGSISIAGKIYGIASAEIGIKMRAYGKFCENQGRRADAGEYLSAASAIAGNVYGHESLIYSFYMLDQARVFQAMGKNAEAEKLLEKAREITTAHKPDAPADYQKALAELATFYSSMGRDEEAEKISTELLTESLQHGGKGIRYGQSLKLVAGLEFNARQWDLATAKLNEALTIFAEELDPGHPLVIDAHNLLGLIRLRQRNYQDAEQHFNYCVEKSALNKTTQSFSYSAYLHNLGTVKTAERQFESAEKLFNESSALRKALGIHANPEEQANLDDDVARLYQAWGNYPKAEKYWSQVIQNLELYVRKNFPFMSDYEKTRFWQKNKEDFEYFNTFALLDQKQNPAIAANWYDIELVTKGILLSAANKVRKRIYTSRDTAQINLYYRWIQTRELLAREYTSATTAQKSKRADSLERKANTMEKDLSMNTEDLKSEKSTTWKDIQRTLGPDEASIELVRFHVANGHLTDSVVYVALILTADTRQNPAVAVLPRGTFLEKRAYPYYRNSIVAQADDTLSWNNFWSALEPFVAGKKKIYLSPDGVYNQVNLKALKKPDGGFLMEAHDIVLLSSTRDVVAIKSRKKIRLGLRAALIGNPKFFLGHSQKGNGPAVRGLSDDDRSGVTELPGTKIEIETVETLLQKNGWAVEALEQTDATEENVKQLPSSRVVHLATHGFFKDRGTSSWTTEDPMLRAGILLSGASNFIQNKEETDGENGILTAYEASNLSLEGTEMVVLSACETARGEIEQGEGVYGLQRAFISAGAETLVMSLWKVDDAATQNLMSLFYANWMTGMDKNDALSQAQRQLRTLYPHPYYWGAFVMVSR